MIKRIGYGILSVVMVCGVCVGFTKKPAFATVSNAMPMAKVSFTFDDGLASTVSQAVPTLAKYGLSGTSYVITNCVGMTTVPNTCRANRGAPYMTWAQVQSLQNTSGWEIGSHTVDHKCLASNGTVDPSDCQAATLTPAEVDSELSQSRNALASHGITATSFAPPYGDYNQTVLAQIAKYYGTMRGFQDTNDNVWPYNEYLLNDLPVRETVDTVTSVEAKIDRAIANKQWLVLTFHDIVVSPSQNPNDYQYSVSELDQIAAYAAAKQASGVLQTVHVNQGAVAGTDNIIPNGTFTNGIADGWTTDNATAITRDTGTNGSYPEAVNAVKMLSAASGSAHLFSPKLTVNPSTTYLFKAFLNLQTITAGQVAFYVDEYDANGNWISGQYRVQEPNAFVENVNFTYKPSSPSVSKASLQVIDGGTGISAFLDTVQMLALTTDAPANLVPNGTFDAGIANGWTTDAAATIRADGQNHGSPANPTNSVSFVATSTNTHLFSPKIQVNAGSSYSLLTYLNLQAISANEVGFYVDEYDANGNWISGKYLGGVRTSGTNNIGFSYTPTSANVSSASLQYIVTGSSAANGYFDDARWYHG
jgi:peptidoglycan/xylan/chitin deacetylase (PgdA/CDA1 family)